MRRLLVAVLTAAIPFCAAQAQEVSAETSGWAALESEGGVRDVATGHHHTCAISQQGRVWCWGRNWYGQVGDGTFSERREPIRITSLIGEFQAVAAGEYHSCALSAAGTVWCWGRNNYGQLGIGSTTSSTVPVALSAPMHTGAQAITAGMLHTCALSANGRGFCWGYNFSGQVGDGSTANQTSPVQVGGFGNNGRAISAGSYHTCGLDRNGRAMCWGWNARGSLGDGTQTNRSVATPVLRVPTNSRMIAAGSSHSCLLAPARRVFCWGDNGNGQLGNGTTNRSLVPIRVPRFRNGGVTGIVAGGWSDSNGHSCAINENGRAMCWGSNGNGQLGDGTTVRRLRPTLVLNLGSRVGTVVGGNGAHTCATASLGRLLCWGFNGYGQLGDGTANTSRTAPVRVRGLLHRN